MEVVGLSAGRNIKLLTQQVEEFRPKVVSLEREEDAQEFKQSFQMYSLEVRYGQEGVQEVASRGKQQTCRHNNIIRHHASKSNTREYTHGYSKISSH